MMVMMTVEITVMNKDAVSECVFTCKCIIIIILCCVVNFWI